MEELYFNATSEIQKKINDKVSSSDLKAEDRLKYLEFKSARKFFFPELNDEKEEEYFNEYLLNHNLANVDHEYLHQCHLSGIYTIHGAENLSQTQPRIYCSYHLGPFASIYYTLILKGISFSLLVGEEDFLLRDHYVRLLNELKVQCNQPNLEVDLINGQKENSIVSIIKTLKQGKSILFLMDGNKGLKDFDPNDKNLIKVRFLNKFIYSRKGFAHISHRLNIPIVPAISYRSEDGKLSTFISKAIVPAGDKEEFSIAAINSIWSLFAEYLVKYPFQWKSIAYTHQFRNKELNKSAEPIDLKANYSFNNRYEFFETDNLYLFDCITSTSFKLNTSYTKFLFNIFTKKINLSGELLSGLIKSKDSLDVLLSNELLIKSPN